jgi:hypothetical protein
MPFLSIGLAGVMTAFAPRLGVLLSWIEATALFVPYAYYRASTDPLPGVGPRRRWLLLPAAFALDCCEVFACVVGSVRHRTVVL